MTAAETELLNAIKRISALTNEVITRNAQLEAEVDDLRDLIEGLNTKLAALQAENHTLNQDAEAANALLAKTADNDNHRLEQLRTLLDSYLNEINKAIHLPRNANTSN